jgi:CcmD family protein
MKRIFLIVVIACVCAVSVAPAFAQPPAGAPGQDGFVPVGSVPQVEQLPAAPMVVGAYAFVWAALLVYVWLLWRRLGRVEHELADLQRRIQQR